MNRKIIIVEGYLASGKSPERGKVNTMFCEVPYSDFDRMCHNLDDFNISGETIKVDRTNFEKVDYSALLKRLICL